MQAIQPAFSKKANGYSNNYWNWGGEDDDFANRLKLSHLKIVRPSGDLGRYRMMYHKLQILNHDRRHLVKRIKLNYLSDGLNSLSY